MTPPEGVAGPPPAADLAATWRERLGALAPTRPVRIMNVCGGHERTISMAGLRALLPPTIELIPGPGCPVCVCPEEDLYAAIELALAEPVTVVTFGDMLRVPVNAPKGEPRSLAEARAAGADIRPIASPLAAADIARAEPGRPVVFLAVGFETTTAPIAALIAAGVPENLSFLVACRRTWPAVAMLLDSGRPGFDALIAPGHVATVMGAEEWRFVPETHGLPTAVAGFTLPTILAAIVAVLRRLSEGHARLDNCYPSAVKPGGNAHAQARLARAFAIVDGRWRGIGAIPASGYALAPAFAHRDAAKRFPRLNETLARRRAGEMPPGCACADVVLGRAYPDQCRLYGRACVPRAPVGPCMVSEEGACRIWWAAGRRPRAAVANESVA